MPKTPTVADVEPEVIIAPPSTEYEYRGEFPDPGEGIPAVPDAPPAEAESAGSHPLWYEPTDTADRVPVHVAKTLATIHADVWQHLSAADYKEFVTQLKNAL